MHKLIQKYNDFIFFQRLPNLSADELLCEVDENDKYITTVEQREWLKRFIVEWEAQEQFERNTK